MLKPIEPTTHFVLVLEELIVSVEAHVVCSSGLLSSFYEWLQFDRLPLADQILDRVLH